MRKIAGTITSLLVTVLLFTAAGYSQYAHMALRVDVPFEFNVGEKTLPAGHYYIVRIGPHTLALHDSNDRFLTAIATGPVQSLAVQNAPKLKFRMRDGRHVLSEVWQSGETVGFELAIPKRLTAVAQERPVEVPVATAATASSGK